MYGINVASFVSPSVFHLNNFSVRNVEKELLVMYVLGIALTLFYSSLFRFFYLHYEHHLLYISWCDCQ